MQITSQMSIPIGSSPTTESAAGPLLRPFAGDRRQRRRSPNSSFSCGAMMCRRALRDLHVLRSQEHKRKEGELVPNIKSLKGAGARGSKTLRPESQVLKNMPSLGSADSHLLVPAVCRPPSSFFPLTEIDAPMQDNLCEVQNTLGYFFHDPMLLVEALTHSSYHGHASYQRLEFVGDAVLNLAFTNYLYISNPGLGPGQLSVLRAANISTEKLACAAVQHGLYRFVRHKAEELDKLVHEFSQAMMREREDEIGGLSYGGGIKKAPKVLADIVESIAAAVYIDSDLNLDVLWKVFKEILAPIITSETLDEQPVTTLYKLCQKYGKSIQFRNSNDGPINVMEVIIEGKLVGSGLSEQKHIAKVNAARDALRHISCSDQYDNIEGNLYVSLPEEEKEQRRD